jgi:ubiquinone biosynthesis protein COQ9
MDYQSLLTEAKDEKSKLEEELKQRLERLRPEKVMEKAAQVAENLNKELKFRAFPVPILSI